MFRFIGVIFKGLPLFFALNFHGLPLFCKFLKSFFHAETLTTIEFKNKLQFILLKKCAELLRIKNKTVHL